MNKHCLVLIFLLAIFSPLSSASERNLGIGFVLGEPTALSVKYWTGVNTAFDFGLGWGLGYDRYGDCWDGNYYNKHKGYCNDRGYYYSDDRYGYRGLHFHADYLFHDFSIIKATEKFPIYYGPGINLNLWNHGNAQFGLRGVLGIAWMPRSAPLDVFLELAPVFQIFPGTWLDMNAGVGARFYF